jgi:hypothetical protein
MYFDFCLSSCYTKIPDSKLLYADSVDALHHVTKKINAYFKMVLGFQQSSVRDVTFSGLN